MTNPPTPVPHIGPKASPQQQGRVAVRRRRKRHYHPDGPPFPPSSECLIPEGHPLKARRIGESHSRLFMARFSLGALCKASTSWRSPALREWWPAQSFKTGAANFGLGEENLLPPTSCLNIRIGSSFSLFCEKVPRAPSNKLECHAD